MMALITVPSGMQVDTTKKTICMMPRQYGKSVSVQHMYNFLKRTWTDETFEDPIWCEKRIIEKIWFKPKTTIYNFDARFKSTIDRLAKNKNIIVNNGHLVRGNTIYRCNAFVTFWGKQYYESLKVMEAL
jgi:hypothetical protein